MILRQSRQTERAAFTLMEIIVVVAIILILAGAGLLGYQKILEDSKVNRVKLDFKSLETAITAYETNNSTTVHSLHELLTPPTGKAYCEPGLLKDPWGQDYQYDPNTKSATGKPLIYSAGVPGTGQQIRNFTQ
jgi:general secretion pathway protein G